MAGPKITYEDAETIRQMATEGWEREEIAEAYDLTPSYVGLILRGLARRLPDDRQRRDLSYRDAATIRMLYRQGKMNQTQLAEKYEVSQSYISNIITGKVLNPHERGKNRRALRKIPKTNLIEQDRALLVP